MLAELAPPMNAAQRAWATRRARDAARVEIIRDNVAAAKRVNEAAGKPVMPDGGTRAKQALQVLR
jgi:hypothetical protein